MSEVTVQIPIREGLRGTNHLLETTYDMDFLPDVGDSFHPLKNDKESGLSFEVYRRYWDEDGKTILIVGNHIIDPPEGPPSLPSIWHAWWSERDGDLIRMLLNNGWWNYGERDSIA